MNIISTLAKFVEEPDFLLICTENPSVEIIERGALRLEAELNLVGIERLKLVAELFVVAVYAVLAVAEQRVTDRREVRAYLMRAPRYKLNLDKRQVAPVVYYAVFGDYLLIALTRSDYYINDVVRGVLFQIAR